METKHFHANLEAAVILLPPVFFQPKNLVIEQSRSPDLNPRKGIEYIYGDST
jgi:hypothetical protein